jgi:hypothetical protein
MARSCVKMALVHDVAESLVGDITPHCGVSNADKHAMELAAVERIQDMLGRDTGPGIQLATVYMFICMYIYVYIHTHTHIYIYIYMCIYSHGI